MKGTPTVPSAPITQSGLSASTVYQQFFARIVNFLDTLLQLGLFADRPAASDVYPGTLYYATDTNRLYISNGVTWLTYSAAPGITQLTGDVTAGPGFGSVAATIAAHAVTYAKMQAVSGASSLLGRGTAGGSDVREITLGASLAMALDVLAIADSAVTPGTYGDASTIPQITVNQKGIVTSVVDVPVSTGSGSEATQITRNTGDGAVTDFALPDFASYLLMVSVNGVVLDPSADYTLSADGGTVTFTAAPGAGEVIVITYILLTA